MNILKNLVGCLIVIIMYIPVIVAALISLVYILIVGMFIRMLTLCGVTIAYDRRRAIVMGPFDIFVRPAIAWLQNLFVRKGGAQN